LTVIKPDPQFWLYISFLYYGLFRPDAECRKLKISDIHHHYIQVRGEDSKNKKTQFVQIAKGLQEQIEFNNLRSQNGTFYIFTNQGIPGNTFPGEKWFYKKHQKMLETLGLNGKNYSQYSWKDTGVIALYRATKDVKLIQRMCRHSSLDQTDKYLKSLGLFLQDEILDSFPSI
jgi:integrase